MTELSWGQFATARPDLAGPGRELLYQFGVGLAFLSTVRPDGGPRLHPMCPLIVGEHLVAHLIPSPKRNDLDADARYALHSFPAPSNEDALYLTGQAHRVEDAELLEKASVQFLSERSLLTEPDGFNQGVFFEFAIARCLLTRSRGQGDWHPHHEVWAVAG